MSLEVAVIGEGNEARRMITLVFTPSNQVSSLIWKMLLIKRLFLLYKGNLIVFIENKRFSTLGRNKIRLGDKGQSITLYFNLQRRLLQMLQYLYRKIILYELIILNLLELLWQ